MSDKSRSWGLRIHDMLRSIAQIRHITEQTDYESFKDNFIHANSVIRDLEVIGEACKHIPDSVLQKYPDIPWQNIRDMRNLLIHEYFGVNLEIVWKTATQELDSLEQILSRIQKEQT